MRIKAISKPTACSKCKQPITAWWCYKCKKRSIFISPNKMFFRCWNCDYVRMNKVKR